MNIVTHFNTIANNHPKHVALIDKTERLNYGETQDLVHKTAAALLLKGIKENDTILLAIPISNAFYIHVLAIFQIGANIVLIDKLFPKTKLKNAFIETECKFIITTKKLYFFKALLFPIQLFRKSIYLKSGDKRYKKIAQKTENDPALFTFTSGTTGTPKAANRTHGFLNIQLSTIIEETKLKLGDIHLSSFPVVNMCNLAVGASSIIPPKKRHEQFWHNLNQNLQPTMVSASIFYANAFSKHINLTKVKTLYLGGACVYQNELKKTQQIYNRSDINLIYGSTEAEPIASQKLNDFFKTDLNEKGLSVGIPHPELKIKLHEEKFNADLNCNYGELLISGQHVLKTYLGDTQISKENKIEIDDVLWHKTGDIAYIKNNNIYLLGRKSVFSTINNNLISPIFIEKLADSLKLSGKITGFVLNDKTLLFYCCSIEELKTFTQKCSITFDKTIYIKSFPKDKRHQSRIDYAKLKKLTT